MADDGKIDVVIAFDPDNPKRQDKTESLPADEAMALIQGGRARLAEKSGGKKDAPKSDTL